MNKILFDKIGGVKTVEAAIEIFYRKVIADERINQYFIGIGMKVQAEKQKNFLIIALGGPNVYSGKNLRDGHAHLVTLGLNNQHFDAVIENLKATLLELGVVNELISEVAKILESTRADILNQ